MKRGFFYLPSICLSIIVSHVSCNGLQGHGGVSNNIKESKKRNVFISEYEVKPNPFMINDTLRINILTAWVENQWAFGKSPNETIRIKGNYQLVIEVHPNTIQNYGLTWRIGIDGDRYVRSCGNNCLISDFNQLPKDTEEWEVQNGWELDSLSEKSIIGKFRIQKKGK